MNKFIKILLLVIGVTLITSHSFCNDSLVVKSNKDTVYYKSIIDPGEVILKYETLLEQESRGHRAFLENLFLGITSILSFVGITFLTLIYLALGKTRKQIRSQVDEEFKLKINDIIKEQTETIDILYKKKLNSFTNYTKSLLIDLTSKAVIKAGDNPLPYIDYESLKGKRILWADNKPYNNTQHREVFNSLGVEFAIANTTEEAIKLLISDGSFDLIISNMGRPPKEMEEDNPREGIVFLKDLKVRGIKIPTIIYTKPANVEKYGDEVISLDAASITQGYSGLFKEILRNIAK